MGTTPDDMIAALQRTVAELRRERDTAQFEKATLNEELATRTAELAERNSEYAERIEYQAATVDVLKAMADSPGDPQPAFELIVRRAQALCDANFAALASYDGAKLRLMAQHGNEVHQADSYAGLFPRPADMGSAMGRAVLKAERIEIKDRASDPEYTMPAAGRSRSLLAQLLLR